MSELVTIVIILLLGAWFFRPASSNNDDDDFDEGVKCAAVGSMFHDFP